MDVAWQKRVESLFAEAVSAREDGVSDTRVRELVCAGSAGDVHLREEVEALLGVHERADGLLDKGNPLIAGTIAGQSRPGDACDESPLQPGQRIGHYTVSRVLGAGGMGVVYVAEQERPRRTVALKVIRPSMASESILRRFEHEGEVLGRLHHPGIAQIYEAGMAEVAVTRTVGSANGPVMLRVPYLAMELVEGLPLIEFAERSALPSRQRLELVRRVCQAVQHAHQKGVIHRDLKPSNILVAAPTERAIVGADHSTRGGELLGQPKVLDFGVARMTRSDLHLTTLRTSVGQLVGTLPYMSPEQVAGDPDGVDTRSDVYALGVILYQLLTGKLPHDVSSHAVPEAARIIRDEQPSRLSSINRVFRGDVDTIVAKAMEKHRDRRYQSAEELGEDIRRHLAGEAILAKRDSAMYVLRKQIGRYRWAVAAAALFVFMTTGFAIYAAVQMTRQARLTRAIGHELSCSNIERGRALGLAGAWGVAEGLLWRERLGNPNLPLAHWALWDLYSRRPLLRTVAESDVVAQELCVSEDGLRYVFIGADDRLQCWNSDFSARLWERQVQTCRRRAVAMSRDGARVVLACEAEPFRMFSGETGELISEKLTPDEAARCLAISPDGRRLAWGDALGTVRVLDLDSGESLATMHLHKGFVWVVLFSPDGRWIASSSADGAVQVRGTVSFERIARFDFSAGALSAMGVSDDGESLVVLGSDRKIRSIRTDGWRAMPPIGPVMSEPTSVAVLGKDQAVVGTSRGLEVWDLSRGVRTQVLASGEANGLNVLIEPRHQRILTTGSGSAVRIWEPAPQMCRHSVCRKHPGWVLAVSRHPRHNWLATGDGSGEIRLWDVSGLDQEGHVEPPLLAAVSVPNAYTVRALEYSRDGGRLAAGRRDGVVMLLDPATLAVIAERRLSERSIGDMKFIAGTSTLLVGTHAGEVMVVDPATESAPEVLLKVDGEQFNAAVSDDGAWLAVTGRRSNVIVWDAASRKEVFRIAGEHLTYSAVFSPDGRTLAVALPTRVIALYDTKTWTRRGTLEGHSNAILQIAFSPDSRLLASASHDGTVRLWDPTEAHELVNIAASHLEVTTLAFSPEGRWLYCGGQDRSVWAYDLWHYDRHIAGNLEFMASRIDPDRSEASAGLAVLRVWAKSVEARDIRRPVVPQDARDADLE